MDESKVVKAIDDRQSAREYLKQQASVIVRIAETLAETFNRGNKLILFGNGGSAADAQHIAGEFLGKIYQERRSLPALAMVSNVSALTAIANDYGYEEVFARQLRGLLKEGDAVLGISTSGESPNVIRAMDEAKRYKATRIAFCGQGGRLAESADIVLAIPSQDTPLIQESHMTAAHIICQLVEDSFFDG